MDTITMDKEKKIIEHYPVMNKEIIEYLTPEKCKVVCDCTLGGGAHAFNLLELMPKKSQFIGIDQDKDAIDIAKQKLSRFGGQFTIIRDNFVYLKEIISQLKINSLDACFFDLGVSLYQLMNPCRGFSFLKEGPLDMRMDERNSLCAAELVNRLSDVELEWIFRHYSDERFARKIARAIVKTRKEELITTTTQLASIIINSLPKRNRFGKIHPATRAFQALRIAVNREIEVLSKALEDAIELLSPKGRIAVISFHSTEDRVVKHTFRNFAIQGKLKILTKKPVMASQEEKQENWPSRSAKLRVAEKCEVKHA